MTADAKSDMLADPDAEAARNGEAVEALLAHPAVRERLDRLRRAWYDEWVKQDDDAKRQTLWVKSKVLADVEREIRAVVSDGQIAKNALNRRQSR